MFIQYLSRQSEVLQSTHLKYPPIPNGSSDGFDQKLCLHTRLPFSESFAGPTSLQIARKGLLHKAPAEAAASRREYQMLSSAQHRD